MLEILRGVVPVFESVTFCVAVEFTSTRPNVRLVGERLTTGLTPVPAKLTACGLPLALSVIVSDALREPTAAGVNVTPIAPTEILLPHAFPRAKSPELAPPMAIPEMLRDAYPMLESSTYCGALGVPVNCWLNVRLGVERPTMGTAGGPPAPPPPPPPQATQIPTVRSAVAKSQPAGRLRAVARVNSTASANSADKNQGHPAGSRRPGGTLRSAVGGAALAWAVVVTVIVAVTEEELLTLTEVGEIEQEIPGPLALQDRFTVPV